MCKCTPNKRTPWCGKPGCEMPEQKTPPEPTPDTELDEIIRDACSVSPVSKSLFRQRLLAWSNKRTRDIAEKVIGENEHIPEAFKNWQNFSAESPTVREHYRNKIRNEQHQTLNTLLGE